jgi:adenine C2-methylase RlmN of 23S rRNA A2503 and tRNA A37
MSRLSAMLKHVNDEMDHPNQVADLKKKLKVNMTLCKK